MRAPLLAALLLLPALPAVGEEPVLVHVRIEGHYEQRWSGDVAVPSTFTITAASGRTHTLHGPTPLGALVAAAQRAGLALEISDEYSDFTVRSVGDERWYNTLWWDYRVDWVEPNYGAQQQWLAWGPPLAEGAEVLWYVDTVGSTPLRASSLGTLPGPACAQAARVDIALADPVHNAGQPWPTLVWGPAPAARLAGAVQGFAVAGVGAGVVLGEGAWWAEQVPTAAPPPTPYVRSPRLAASCP